MGLWYGMGRHLPAFRLLFVVPSHPSLLARAGPRFMHARLERMFPGESEHSAMSLFRFVKLSSLGGEGAAGPTYVRKCTFHVPNVCHSGLRHVFLGTRPGYAMILSRCRMRTT